MIALLRRDRTVNQSAFFSSLQLPAFGVEEGIWPLEISDRDEMGHHLPEACTAKPGMQMKRRRLDQERRRKLRHQIERDGIVGCRTDRRRDPCKHRQRSPMDVTGCNQSRSRMALHERRELAGVTQVLPIHVINAGHERWVMQEEHRRPGAVVREGRIEPSQGIRVQDAMGRPGEAGIDEDEVERADRERKVERVLCLRIRLRREGGAEERAVVVVAGNSRERNLEWREQPL